MIQKHEKTRVLSEYSEVDEYCLALQEYAISMAANREIVLDKVMAEHWINEAIYRLHLSQRLPTDVLQQDVEICRYPASNWQWLKQFIPFMKPKYRIHTITEHLTFPKIDVPPKMLDDMRIYIEKGMYTGNW
jgi:hypothetical protein